MNIYEIHIGSWKKNQEGRPLTYEQLGPELTQYCKEHHYTHVEFMPLTEYPADESWGYQVLGFYSATSRYGTPHQLMDLINLLHTNGIGVILDFVPVHFALDYYGLRKFDGSALYEYPSDDTGYSEWGSHNFNYFRGEVRSFLQSSAAFWMEEYHVDGIRMDAVSNGLYWQGDKGRGSNEGAIMFFKNMNVGLAKRFPTAMKIAEDSSDYHGVTEPVTNNGDGLGFDYKWDMGWMNDTLEFFKYFDIYDRGGYIQKIMWSMYYFRNEKYILPFSHDEVVHGKGSIIGKMLGDYDQKFQQIRLLYMYMMTHPGKKLNFMGNEIAQFDEWWEKREVDWNLLNYQTHRDFSRYLTALNDLYMKEPALYEMDYDPDHYFAWVETSRYEVRAYIRSNGKESIMTVLNFGGYDLKDVKLGFNKEYSFELLFKSLDYIQCEHNFTAKTEYIDPEDPEKNWYYTLFDLPPFGGMIFKINPPYSILEKKESKEEDKLKGKEVQEEGETSKNLESDEEKQTD